MRRRTFVGLTGAALFGAVLADPIRSGQADAIESFAAVLAAYAPERPVRPWTLRRTCRRWPLRSPVPSATTRRAGTPR